MRRPAGIIRVLCTLNYEPPILYIKSPLHRAGAKRNFREFVFYALGGIDFRDASDRATCHPLLLGKGSRVNGGSLW
jgi:hypothetical protein